MSRPAGPSSAPPPPSRPPLGKDAFSTWLAGSPPADEGESNPDSAIVLEVLRDAGPEIGIRDLQKESGLAFLEFSGALEQLRAAGKLDIAGRPGYEQVRLLGSRQ